MSTPARSTRARTAPASTGIRSRSARAFTHRSASATRTYRGPVSPAAICFFSAGRVTRGIGALERLDDGGDDRTSDVGRDAIERAALLVDERRGLDLAVRDRRGRQVVFLAERQRI